MHAFYISFRSTCRNTVDAVYAMAFALHNILKEQCNNVEFSQCDVLQTGTWGPDLLRAIREVSFTGMQGTQVRLYCDIFIETNDSIIYFHLFLLFCSLFIFLKQKTNTVLYFISFNLILPFSAFYF